jgi:hemoglobin-like flavoprotein
MGLQVELLRSSFARIVELSPKVTHRFYQILFERYPQAKRLFGRHSLAKQEKMLAEALVAVLDHLEDAPWLSGTLRALGGKHAGYGVTDEMYAWVGESLISTFAEALDEEWTQELQSAWVVAFSAIAGLMQAGAREAQAGAAAVAGG